MHAAQLFSLASPGDSAAASVRREPHPDEIVGTSLALRRVLAQAAVVAPTDAIVLIQGETGTGKEVVAHRVHALSARCHRPFVKLNCAAIPAGLLESELFGHERGAFTGAIAQKPGRFELANGGTLFLDEVGEIPLELQPKLLRVLQEQEFERLGGLRTLTVNVRVVAATNRNLFHMVEEGRFRDDLYYRLNVFPIELPPLRERPEDIPALVRHFVDRFARRMNRSIEVVLADDLAALQRYSWPGNVRELANVIERATILSSGKVLEVVVPKRPAVPAAVAAGKRTLDEVKRARIREALEDANWLLAGPRGAAASLGMKRTTLQSMMKRLEIVRPE